MARPNSSTFSAVMGTLMLVLGVLAPVSGFAGPNSPPPSSSLSSHPSLSSPTPLDAGETVPPDESLLLETEAVSVLLPPGWMADQKDGGIELLKGSEVMAILRMAAFRTADTAGVELAIVRESLLRDLRAYFLVRPDIPGEKAKYLTPHLKRRYGNGIWIETAVTASLISEGNVMVSVVAYTDKHFLLLSSFLVGTESSQWKARLKLLTEVAENAEWKP